MMSVKSSLRVYLLLVLIVVHGQSIAEIIRVGVISESANKWPMWVALEKQFFTDEGLDVDLILTGEATVQLKMLRSGDLEIAHQAADHILRAVESGDDFILVHTITRATNELLVAPGIETFADLKGKVFALANLNVSYWLLFDRILRGEGIMPGDYTVLANTGGPVKRMQLLKEKQAHVTYMNPPASIEAEADGYKRLTGLSDHFPDFPASSIATRREWAEVNRQILIRYLRAYIRATEWLGLESNKEEAFDIAVRTGGFDRELLPGAYEAFVRYGMVRYGTMNPEGFSQIIELLHTTGVLKEKTEMKKYADSTYQQQALDTLYR